ncbi:MAG: hypothetical protein ABIP35_11980, partial [Ginsengibacter sp.]
YTGNLNISDEEWFNKLHITTQGSSGIINVMASTLDSRQSMNNSSQFSIYSPFNNLTGSISESKELSADMRKQLEKVKGEVIETRKQKDSLKKGLEIVTIDDINKTSGKSFFFNNDSINTVFKSTINGVGFSTTFNSKNLNRSQQVYQSVAVYGENGEVSMLNTSLKREINIYVPKNAILHIDSKYGDVAINQDIAELNVKITNASLDMQNADKADIECSFGNVRTLDIKNFKLNLKNGKLYGKNFEKAVFTTSYSQIEAGDIGKLVVNSTSDDYDLETINTISAIKNYGGLRINKLTEFLSLVGNNADVRIKNVDPRVSAISIDNKFADLRVPLTSLPNYVLSYTGNYSNIYAPFTLQSSSAPTSIGSEDLKVKPVASTSKNNFIVTQGDVSGTHTKLEIKCESCSLDFK